MKTILFQGASVTECGRDHDAVNYKTPAQLGRGYVNNIAARLMLDNPGMYKILNRGVAGNRIVDLYARWKADALNWNPDIISIQSGVNDVWYELNGGNGVEPERFDRLYRMLLNWTCQALPRVKLLLMEPFALPCGAVDNVLLDKLQLYSEIVRNIAGDFDAVFLPLQEKFDMASWQMPHTYWVYDGVHPTAAGNQLIADAWLKAAKVLLEE